MQKNNLNQIVTCVHGRKHKVYAVGKVIEPFQCGSTCGPVQKKLVFKKKVKGAVQT